MKTLLFILSSLIPITAADFRGINSCRSYCGNITIDYPFGLKEGCGNPGYRDLMFCMNDVLMFHISSGSYRVLDIDYAYRSVTLHDPHMSTCDTIVLSGKGNGFQVEDWRQPYFNPMPENVFMLIGCSPRSPLFQGFPEMRLPCRNVSGMGCEEYLSCPAWEMVGYRRPGRESGSSFGSGPPECCAVGFESMKAINLTKLECEGYSSAYSLAPLRPSRPAEWAYGIRVKYDLQGSDAFCRACVATAGTCGYESGDGGGLRHVCMCGTVNSTTNCDSVVPSSGGEYPSVEAHHIALLFIYLSMMIPIALRS